MAARKEEREEESAKKTGRKKTSSRRYGKKASEKVERAMHEYNGASSIGRSGRRVKSRKQAIAIGLSEAREAGGKVPNAPTGRSKRGGSQKKK